MTTIINIDRLKIYRNYGGDIDGLLRMGKKSDLDAFGSDLDNIWGKITNFSQDIELIEKGLVSKGYADKSIEEIKSLCDQPTFYELTKTIQRQRLASPRLWRVIIVVENIFRTRP